MSTQAHVPDGAGPRPHLTRPCPELIDSWLGDPTGARRVEATRHFRDVLGRFASGVTVVTATGPDGPVGLTCQSFTSVSLDPPLVLFVPSRTSRSWPQIRAAGTFCVNFLSHGQEELANTQRVAVAAVCNSSKLPICAPIRMHPSLAITRSNSP